MIKEQKAGEKTTDVCRRYRINQSTFYKYKSKNGGMEPSNARRLRDLKAENAKLKKLHWQSRCSSEPLMRQWFGIKAAGPMMLICATRSSAFPENGSVWAIAASTSWSNGRATSPLYSTFSTNRAVASVLWAPEGR